MSHGRHGWRAVAGMGFALFAMVWPTTDATAFPPYRTTDADTADPWSLETRLGVAKANVDKGETEVLSPLLRANVGLPNHVELVSEFEYLPAENRVEDGALGVKWIPLTGNVSIGNETLLLLPVNRAQSGAGVESQILLTWRGADARLHLNAGGFDDPRGGRGEAGWRASALEEWPRADNRFGLEISAKDSNRKSIDARLGAGLIRSLGTFDVRIGIQAGLSAAAPDASMSLWLSRAFSL